MRNYVDENKVYSYMLAVIDTFLNFPCVEPHKKKDGKNVTIGLENILERAKFFI